MNFGVIEKKKYINFALINSIAVLICIAVTGLLRDFNNLNAQIFITAIAIILIQYPFINKAKTWKVKCLLFYFSFLVFCYSFTFQNIWQEFDQLKEVESIIGLFLRGFAYVIFGHIYGLIFVPLIILVNFSLGKHCFVNNNKG